MMNGKVKVYKETGIFIYGRGGYTFEKQSEAFEAEGSPEDMVYKVIGGLDTSLVRQGEADNPVLYLTPDGVCYYDPYAEVVNRPAPRYRLEGAFDDLLKFMAIYP
jgi:hypothetical protein